MSLPGFTIASTLGRPRAAYSTASASATWGFRYSFNSSNGVLQSTSPAQPVCPSGTVCCEFDAESHSCIGGCCSKASSCCPDGKPGSGNLCTNVNSDPANCGGCSKTCALGTRCANGVCTASCPAGQTLCGNQCVDLTRDPANCGACGHICTTQACCAGQCINVSNDNNNCGACGVVCAPNQLCEGSTCVCRGTVCNGVCTDTISDPNNCGNCGFSCNGGTCVGGTCDCSSAPGLTLCGDTCVNLQTNPGNCGSCGNQCNAAAGQSCCSDHCTNLSSDDSNCGACGQVCDGGGGHAKKTCQNGVCHCQAEYGYVPCGETCCGKDILCCGGKCGPPLSPPGWACCNDEIAYLPQNQNNCGKCGNVCGVNQLCVNGVCETCASNCQACDLASGQCGLPCPDPNAACNLFAGSASNKDYVSLSDYFKSQGFTLTSNEAITLLRGGAVVGYSFVTQMASGSQNEAIVTLATDSNYHVLGTSALLLQNSILQYGLIVDANGEIAKFPSLSTPSSAPSTSSMQSFRKGVSSLNLSPVSPGCNALCNEICQPFVGLPKPLVWGACSGLGWSICIAGLELEGPAVAICLGVVTKACQDAPSPDCANFCLSLCACNSFTGVPCGISSCCPLKGYACINGACLPCPEPCTTYNYQTGQCDGCGDDPCFQCDTTSLMCSLVGTIRCGQPGQPGYTCCPVGQSCCNGSCVDLQSNPQNCGACDQACGATQTCENGKCICIAGGEACGNGCCGVGEACCNGACVDLRTDSQDCGACGHACNPAQTCQAGQCVCPGGGEACGSGCCAAGQTCCGGHCVNTASDPQNCGSCGRACQYGGAFLGGCANSRCICPNGSQYCYYNSLGDVQCCSAINSTCLNPYYCLP